MLIEFANQRIFIEDPDLPLEDFAYCLRRQCEIFGLRFPSEIWIDGRKFLFRVRFNELEMN